MSYILNDKKDLLKIKYYGGGDFSGGLFVSNVIKNLDYIEQNLDHLNGPINTIDELIQYFWTISFKEMAEEIDQYKVEDEIKNRIKDIAKKIKDNPKYFIDFVSKNYEMVLSRENIKSVEWYEYLENILKLSYGKYSSGIDEKVFNLIEKKYPLIILSKYEICGGYYIFHEDAFKTLFIGLKNTRVFDDRVYVEFLLNHVNGKMHEFLEREANFICSRSLETFKKDDLDSDTESILETKDLYIYYMKLAKVYELKSANEYRSIKIDVATNEYLKKHGNQSYSSKIDLTKVLEFYTNNKEINKFLTLTHGKKNEKIINSLDDILTLENRESLSEVFTEVGNPKTNKFPYYKQHYMEIDIFVRSGCLRSILYSEDLSKDLYEYINAVCIFVQKNVFENEINIVEELLGEYEMIANIINLSKKDKTQKPITKALLNGCAVNLCGTIEKILRNVFIKENFDKIYINPNKLTMGSLLNPKANLTSLSDGIKYYLEFYLVKEIDFHGLEEERPGKDIRNIQMHNRNKKYENTNLETCITLLYFALSLIDDLYVDSENVKLEQ